MPSAHIVRVCTVSRTPRVMQMEGLFDVSPSGSSSVSWDVNLPIEGRAWNIGLIVGSSGSGKTTIARQMFGPHMVESLDWPEKQSILDAFPASMGIKDITALLGSVGFSSPPSWIRPYGVLSNGEKFRVTVARALAENRDLAVVDEFTSVVDRTVAKIGSAAAAKAVRARKQKLIAVSCHYDIIDWLQPDWVYDPGTDSFQWRELRRRPRVHIEICCADNSTWKIFKRHHYLTGNLANSARCFVGLVDGAPAAFASVISFPHATRPGWREHRTVCLPDFQGVGIGNAVSEHIAGIYRATGKPYYSATSQPAMIGHRARSPLWRMNRAPSRVGKQGKTALRRCLNMSKTLSVDRLTAGFEYIGPALIEEARSFGLNVAA